MNIINLININVLVLMFQGSRSHASGPGHEDVEAIQCLILQLTTRGLEIGLLQRQDENS
jgi:hypothetical protein